jgi:hypothetical protein
MRMMMSTVERKFSRSLFRWLGSSLPERGVRGRRLSYVLTFVTNLYGEADFSNGRGCGGEIFGG